MADNGVISLKAAIRSVVGKLAGDFTSKDVQHGLQADYPEVVGKVHRSSIPGALAQMVRDDELVLVEKGVGRSFSLFRRGEPGKAARLTTDNDTEV